MNKGTCDDNGLVGLVVCAVSIIKIRIDGYKLIVGKCPRRCGPDDETGVFDSFQRKADINTRVSNFAVSLTHFARTESGTSLRPPPYDLVSAIKQSAIEESFEGPPNAFDIALVIGHIGLRQIDPETESFGHAFPFLHVSPNALLATLNEGFDSVRFDFVFAMDAEFFADLDFDG